MIQLLVPLLALLISACTSIPSASDRRDTAEALAQASGWQALNLHTTTFDLLAYVPTYIQPDEHLTVYVEGDGLAWITPSHPSPDPTPRNPLALKLALAHPEGNAAYMARPCQYQQSAACAVKYWTDARFAPKVIEASSQAIDVLKSRFNAKSLTLVGFSGGGAVATLLAARRNDVDRLVTVAGNLDHRAWTTRHRITPLRESLNPADHVRGLSRVRQWHFVGGRDKVIPPELVESFAKRFPAAQQPTVLTESEFDHHCCWVDSWPRLWRSIGSINAFFPGSSCIPRSSGGRQPTLPRCQPGP